MAGKTGTLVAVLAGAAIGAGIGILFAPDQGSNTRRKIKQGYGTKKDELKDKITELTEQLKNKLGSAKGEGYNFDHLVANVESEKNDIINTLERKLEELRGTRFSDFGKDSTPASKGSGMEGSTGFQGYGGSTGAERSTGSQDSAGSKGFGTEGAASI